MTSYGRRREPLQTSGIVYDHMSSHYRRILNARPAVDTSTPESFKPRVMRPCEGRRRPGSALRPSSGSRHNTVGSKVFMDRASVTNQSCNENVRREWAGHSRSRDFLQGDYYKAPELTSKIRKTDDIIERHINQFEAYQLDFWPRILKTEATSKLREMRVYHPPRRRTNKNWAPTIDTQEDKCRCVGECTCALGSSAPGKEASQASSRDSAYNGGNSSTPDSQSPTPYQQCVVTKHTATQTDRKPARSQKAKSKQDDVAYLKFIHDITVEAVECDQFTDKSLTRIIDKHIAANMAFLNKERMQKEVSQLRTQLGITTSKDHDILPQQNYEIVFDECESWTTHYLQLSDTRTNESDRAISERLDSLNVAEDDSDDEKDSDSSRETTIKEVILASSGTTCGEDSEGELDESIEGGSLNYSDDESISG